MKSILIIDDDSDFRETIAAYLTQARYEVTEVDCPEEGFQMLWRDPHDCVICDLHMPWSSGEDTAEFKTSFEVGIKTIKELAWALPHMPIIAVSSAAPLDLERVTRGIGSLYALSKPVRKDDLLSTVQRVLTLPVSQVVH